MIELDKYEQQIILACKGWSKWSEVEDDFKAVKVVVSQYYGMDINDMSQSVSYQCLIKLFCKISTKFSIENFMLDLFKDDWEIKYKDNIDREHIIKKLVSQLKNMPIKDSLFFNIFKELKSDYDILNKGLEMEVK